MGNMVINTVYFTEEQNKQLRELAKETRIPKAVLVREGIDLLLNKYNGKRKKK
jgi:predicted DNA-binding protein